MSLLSNVIQALHDSDRVIGIFESEKQRPDFGKLFVSTPLLLPPNRWIVELAGDP